MKLINKISMVLMVFLCLSCSCTNIKKYPFQVGSSNPTEYIFQMSLDELREKIISDFESLLSPDIEEIMCRKLTVYKETDRPLYDSIFNLKENSKDLILSTANSKHATLGYSDVYFIGKKPLLYKAEFHLHFERINSTTTKIKINTLNPRVIVGKQVVTLASHRGYKYKKVEPTTIEEYKILLRIGKIAGEKKMPFINLPEQKYNIP